VILVVLLLLLLLLLLRLTIANQVSEVQKLTHIINEADAERSRMKKVGGGWVLGGAVKVCNGRCRSTTK